MTHEITGYNENEQIDDTRAAPPLCLVHYFAEDLAYPPERDPKPPGSRLQGRIAEREGNLLILEFAPPPKTAPPRRSTAKRMLAKAGDCMMLLLLLACLLGCLAAFRF